MMAANVHATEQVYEQHAEPYDGAYGMSPMPQYGEAPVAMWQSVPIAPPLPSARDLASMDFQQAFVHKCLYPSQSFLVSEGFAEHEEEKEESEKRDEVVETKVRTPRLPREPQPDYFGHLLGHPISADDDEDFEEDSTSKCRDEAEQNDVEDPVADAPEEPIQEDVVVEALESPAAPEQVGTPEVEHEVVDVRPESKPVPSESDKEHEISEESTEDDDVDYFGHIMGHPMNHSNSQRKIKTPKEKEALKIEETDSQETQGSVLGLFLGGVEVCDREENIGQFTARPGEDSADAGGGADSDETAPVAKTEEATVPEVEAVEETPEVVDAPKVELPRDAVQHRVVEESSKPSPPEVAMPAKQESRAPVAPQPSRDPEVVQARSVSVEAKKSGKAEQPVETSSARTTTKKKSFFAGLCGSRNQD
ncbi:hypothetical protein FOZ61_002506 [Perkinsus olseni]|uniref:Uncharacterized protein n=1 Tax=Perkinsus olseni TaxID=32597 RepID=A0A7J6MEU5_PEROL|nr:hypothetical protein FOZ61_002506 [Perkinsus olseni]KAF4675539.1 hypothetical protein FOL46_001068 [Perkinsus olseni]